VIRTWGGAGVVVDVSEIGLDRVGETPASRNRRYRSMLLGLNWTGVRGSSGATFVTMMEPAHLRDRHDPPGFWCLHRA
jgi:hypothetical protein